MDYFNSKLIVDDDLEKVIIGDFNCPNISWLSGNIAGPVNSVNSTINFQKDFLEKIHNNGLSWLITDEITRRRKVGNVVQESTIDQIFCSEQSLVSEFKISHLLAKVIMSQ